MPKELHEATRDCTIHLSKRYQKKKGKHLAPRSIREIRKFVEREMLTKVIFISLLDYTRLFIKIHLLSIASHSI